MPMMKPRRAFGAAGFIQYSDSTNRALIEQANRKRSTHQARQVGSSGNKLKVRGARASVASRKLRSPKERARRGTKGLVRRPARLAKEVWAPIAVALTPCAERR